MVFIIAKGRTNIELREQFILAQGVSQSMAPFIPKSPGGSSSGTGSVVSGTASWSSTGRTASTASGPIMKVTTSGCRKMLLCTILEFFKIFFLWDDLAISLFVPRRVGLVVSVSASHAIGREFMTRPGHTKDHHKNGTSKAASLLCTQALG